MTILMFFDELCRSIRSQDIPFFQKGGRHFFRNCNIMKEIKKYIKSKIKGPPYPCTEHD